MRLIIAGSRSVPVTLENLGGLARRLLELGWEPELVLCGCAVGADALGEWWAKCNKIEIAHYPADWTTYDNAAGPIRNREMAKNADALFAIRDGYTPGTVNMIKEAHNEDLEVEIWDLKG